MSADRTDAADKAQTGTPPPKGTRTGSRRATTLTDRLKARVHGRRALIALAITVIAALITTLLVIGDPNRDDLGPLHADLGAPDVPQGDRILIDQDHNGTPDTVLDLNDNNRADKGEPVLDDLTDQRITIVNDITANPSSVHESLITPPGDDWWTFTTSQAADLLLWNLPTPKDANWYGVTTGNATAKQAATGTYHSLHIGFPTRDAALAYAETFTDDTLSPPPIRSTLRGTILTITHAFINPDAEPFPKASKNLDTTSTSLHPTAAAWTLNLGRRHTDLANQAVRPAWAKAITDYYKHLGYTDTTIWNAVAAKPTGPWIGTLTDYNVEDIDLAAASLAITGTERLICEGDMCTTAEGNLAPQLFPHSEYATTGRAVLGAETIDSGPWYAPSGAHLAFRVNNSAVLGVLNGTHNAPVGPYSRIDGTITGDTDHPTLTATFTKAEHPSATDYLANAPDGFVPPGTPDKGEGTTKFQGTPDHDKGNKGDTNPNPNPIDPNQPQPGDPVEPIKPDKNANLPTPEAPPAPTQ